MKMTNEKLYESLGILVNVNETGRLGYACARNLRKIMEDVKEYKERRQELIEKYGNDIGDGRYEIPKENVSAFESELREYAEIEIDVPVMTVSEDVFCSGTLTTKEMYVLDWMVED